jgi:hypothetical protein
MGWMNQIGGILQQYMGAAGEPPQPPPGVEQHFDQVSQNAPQGTLTDALSQVFRSDQTPSFGQMVSQLFNQSDNQQRAGLLNRLLASVGPGVLSEIGGLGGLAGLASGGQVTPQQASQISANDVQELATHAEQKNPSIVDQISGFYAQHPDVVKALGGLALAIAIQHIARRER